MRSFVTMSLALVLWLSLASCTATGQSTRTGDKVPLDHSDFDQWRAVSNEQFTRDGDFLIYSLNPQEGDGEVVVRNLRTNRENSIARGQRFQVNHSGTHLVMFLANPYAEERQARIDGKRLRDVFTDTLAVYSLATAELEKIGEVTSFKMPDENGDWLAYRFERNDRSAASSDSKDASEGESESGEASQEPNTDEADEDAEASPETTKNDLVLRDLRTGEERVFPWVDDYFFSEGGERLVMLTLEQDTLSTAGIHVLELESGELFTVSEGLKNYRGITMTADGSQIAFIAQQPEPETETENGEDAEENSTADDDTPEYYGLWFVAAGSTEAQHIADENSSWLAESWMINEHSSPSFSEDGRRLFFGTAPEPMRRDRSVEAIDMAEVDIWHWQDERLQSQQLVQLRNDQRQTFRAVYHIADDRFLQLEDRSLENISVPDRGNAPFAMGAQNRHYLYLTQWDGFPARTDLFVVDIETGERSLFAEGIKAASQTSPDGRYFIWYDYADQNWYTYEFETGRSTNLTGHLDVAFFNELHDAPSDPNPYGIEGWTEGDARVIIRDRFDLWVFDPAQEGSGHRLTGGYGRENQVTLRSFAEDREARHLPSDEIFLSAFFDVDKSSGFYTAKLEESNPNQLWRGDFRTFTPVKAADAERWMVRKSTFQQYQDVYLTDRRFRNFQRVTHANPQQDQYLWGDVELFHFTSLDGERLEGLLYTPEDFDPDKEYPMIVYFYERTSNRLHWYRPPAPSASTITPAFYTSRGYIVAMPDIVYTIGNPGRSAENAVIGMTLHLLDRGFVDADRIGLQGQSWGGYQIAHIITRTDMFAAAMAGAPVSNMISAYGGIRWASGLNRQFQYEKTQSRIGGTLWEKPTYYIENSPIFFANRVRTPLLMMHNDEDGAVPWYQGIEFFTALKRLNQPVWMLNYNGEAHNLRERVNRKDLSRRMQQFFDHYLMDAPMPVWMRYGVPAIEKGLHQGFELTD
ncbi:Dipeptidyl aminopeptidase/acylaminoacyl peptidase [Cyclonatronum proteinivorum]|uniref:Dipeptidyl aminopeptidase/acylaminoacyl peptidase n=1 Tax=Cyclonatronum proteinivorum TaxID=1457365 RepID=A0A345UM20_9BACT|nr:prolyl oligopeptidase family serine peptidase [Cyclonatronum proteinivorum]AXJ01522.1 Dipeptidyl aminopeptidase/acylaminoacyl peptidase [Cyclonatronum proteinivorum]